MTKFKVFTLLFFTLLLFLRIYAFDFEINFFSSEEAFDVFKSLNLFFNDQIFKIFPQLQASLVSGILLGNKADLPQELRQLLLNTSTIHIAVVSGQNLTLLSGFLLSLSPLLGRKKAILLSMILSTIYALLTGFQIPVIRALIMFILTSLASFFGRDKDGFWVLILTGWGFLIIDPNLVKSISFQLSFSATLGVVIVAPVLVKYFKFLPEIIKEDFSVSLAASALTLPIIAFNFHQMSIVGLLVNTLVLWTISPIMILGILVLLVSLLNINLAIIFSSLVLILINYFIFIIELFGRLNFSSIYFPSVSLFFWIGYYILLFGIYLIVKKVVTKKEKCKH